MELRARRRWTVYGIALCAMGLLLWSRLILVTGRPRTAVADPKAASGPRAPAPGAGAAPEPSGQDRPESTER